ncbi:RHO guanyl-nucleotide exchange factor 7 [Perilla frutescens var. hirtella]|nr:RHO guanyl-nucleotide exchange factor 7 [Perilla frutescens var. frutescens]KAH6775886.1 RHO guanyl-nucleotide exchange factor 7 [Perilla frutescens var. hirtella]
MLRLALLLHPYQPAGTDDHPSTAVVAVSRSRGGTGGKNHQASRQVYDLRHRLFLKWLPVPQVSEGGF